MTLLSEYINASFPPPPPVHLFALPKCDEDTIRLDYFHFNRAMIAFKKNHLTATGDGEELVLTSSLKAECHANRTLTTAFTNFQSLLTFFLVYKNYFFPQPSYGKLLDFLCRILTPRFSQSYSNALIKRVYVLIFILLDHNVASS